MLSTPPIRFSWSRDKQVFPNSGVSGVLYFIFFVDILLGPLVIIATAAKLFWRCLYFIFRAWVCRGTCGLRAEAAWAVCKGFG